MFTLVKTFVNSGLKVKHLLITSILLIYSNLHVCLARIITNVNHALHHLIHPNYTFCQTIVRLISLYDT